VGFIIPTISTHHEQHIHVSNPTSYNTWEFFLSGFERMSFNKHVPQSAKKIFCTYLLPCFLLENTKKSVIQTFNLPLAIQNNEFFFSWASLASFYLSKAICVTSFGPKIYIKMFTTSILRWLKKN
jgi:hypothetical protein